MMSVPDASVPTHLKLGRGEVCLAVRDMEETRGVRAGGAELCVRVHHPVDAVCRERQEPGRTLQGQRTSRSVHPWAHAWPPSCESRRLYTPTPITPQAAGSTRLQVCCCLRLRGVRRPGAKVRRQR